MIDETRPMIFMHERGDMCVECNGTGVSGGFDCELCDGEGYLAKPPPCIPQEHDNG